MLTLVPARGGSKRVPRKNIRALGGAPLILWTLRRFRHLDPVVSTEDREIAALALSERFRVLKRPDELATDDAPMWRVALHALENTGESELLLLQPTSPFRNPGFIDELVSLPAPAATFTQIRHVYVNEKPLDAAQMVMRPTGAGYFTTRAILEKERTFLPEGTRVLLHGGAAALDIDTEWDWRMAEAVVASGWAKAPLLREAA